MFSISIKGSFEGPRDLGLDRISMDATCPRCQLQTPFFLRDVRLGRVLVCRGCRVNIALNDYLGGYERTRKRLTRSMDDLVKTLSRLGQ